MEKDLKKDLQALQGIIDSASEFIVNYSFQILGALIILVVGWFIAKWASRLVMRLCERANLDITLSKFFGNVANILVLAFVIIIALGKFGITIAPFIAALGALTFGATLALQGPLSNYGAGLTIILTRPFVVGDTLKLLNVTGIVEEIKLAYTILSTEDGESITIPNKHIAGEILINSNEDLVVEAVLGIHYDSDTEKAMCIIRHVLAGIENVRNEPVPQVGIQNFGDSAIEIGYRYWVPTRSYYETLYAVNNAIFTEFKQQSISIPYPQREVRMLET